MNQNFDMTAYATQVQMRTRRINEALSMVMQAERRSINMDTRVKNLNTYIYQKAEILTEFILMGNFTQSRINVIEQYLQELEVLLNLDQ